MCGGSDVVVNLIFLGLLFWTTSFFFLKGLRFLFQTPLRDKTVIRELVLLRLKFGSQSRVKP